MDRIERIREMERVLDVSTEAVQRRSSSLESYAAVQAEMQALFDYYFGPQWRTDSEADDRGELPPGLKRGVLSEDAVYDLFTDNQRLLERLHLLAGKHKKYPD